MTLEEGMRVIHLERFFFFSERAILLNVPLVSLVSWLPSFEAF